MVDVESEFRSMVRRSQWLRRVRPFALRALLARVAAPDGRRRIVTTSEGLSLYLDPLSHLGSSIGTTGTYEPENTDLFKRSIRPGDAILDIGANEGYFSALAARLAGPGGFVAAVEPQHRLRDVIEINLRLNGTPGRFRLFNAAVGEAEGSAGRLHLYPFLNNGASSLVRKGRFLRAEQPVEFVSIDTILRESGVDHFDFVKVDTEGFEDKVIEALLDSIRAGRVATLYVDYHEPILRSRGVDPRNVHQKLLDAGMRLGEGTEPQRFSGYVLYAADHA
jgi:FkbM family methyltransferase